MARIYRQAVVPTAVTTAVDFWEITSHATKNTWIHSLCIGQNSDVGDAQDEILNVQIITGYTSSGTGGTQAAVPVPCMPGDSAFGGVVDTLNTTVANTGTALIHYCDGFNVRAGWLFMPTPETRILIPAATRCVIRVTAPADSLTMFGTAVFEEIG